MSSVAEQLREGERRLRADAGVLQQDRVAEDEVRAGHPGHLVEGVVPRLDRQEDAERLGLEDGLTGLRLERLLPHDPGPLVGVVAEDLRRCVHLLLTLADQLSHLERDQLRESVLALGKQLRRPADDLSPLPDRPPAPAPECGVGRLDRTVDLLAVERLERAHGLARIRVHGHVVGNLRCRCHGLANRPHGLPFQRAGPPT
jgi:hypothetical protein